MRNDAILFPVSLLPARNCLHGLIEKLTSIKLASCHDARTARRFTHSQLTAVVVPKNDKRGCGYESSTGLTWNLTRI